MNEGNFEEYKTLESLSTPDEPGVKIKKPGSTVKEEILGTSKIEPPKYQPPRNVEEFIQQNKDPRLSPEEQKASARRERTNKVIAGVGDMLSALSNMYFATQGAPNSYNPQNAMLPKMQARYDQLTKDHEARVKDYTSGLQRARQLDQQYQLTWEQLKRQYDRDRVQEERTQQQEAARKAKEEAAAKKLAEKQEAIVKANEARDNNNMYEAAYYDAIAAGFTPEMAERQAKAKSSIQAKKDQQKKSGRGGRARSQNNAGRTTTVYDKNGKPIKTTTVQSGIHTPIHAGGSLLPK